MKIGVVSDTHSFFDPRLPELLNGVDVILHAGDVGSQAILDELASIAPVHAVCGNIDSAEFGLPPTLTCSFDGIQTYMLHEISAPQRILQGWARADALVGKPAENCQNLLASLPEHARVIIFGHSHDPFAVVLAGKLFLNPGSAGKRRFSLPRCLARLETSGQGAHATFLELERYNDREPPEGVWLPAGGVNA